MDSGLISILKPRVLSSISKGISLYEKELRDKSSSKVRALIEESMSALIYAILDRIENDEAVSIFTLGALVLESLIKTQVSAELFIGVLSESNQILTDYAKTQTGNYSQFLDVFGQYKTLLEDAVLNERLLAQSGVFEILQSPKEYQYADSQFVFYPKEIDKNTNRVYTLFNKTRYWEEYQTLDSSTSYSPLSINRTSGRLSSSSSVVDIIYRDAVVYKNEVYKLRPNIPAPSRFKFDETQWEKYSSRRLDPSKTFRSVLSNSVDSYYTGFLDNALSINSVTSDSKIKEYSDPVFVNPDFLVSTFGGEGKALFDSISELKAVCDYTGAFEGSVIGSLDYISAFSEFMLAAVYGRNATSVFNIDGPDTTFGRFDYLFLSTISNEKIPGLKFLEGFIKLKSFSHYQVVTNAHEMASPTLAYNPLYEKYKPGLEDRYVAKIERYSYTSPPSIDLLLSSIESLYNKCLYVGDVIKACFSAMDKRGRLVGSEGLGNVEAQLQMLQKVFPPGAEIRIMPENVRAPGLSGGIKLFLESYSRLYNTFVYTKLPASSLETIRFALTSVEEKLDGVIYTIRKLGISSFSYIPNIQFKFIQGQNTAIISYLTSLGFKNTEIEKLITAKNLSDLIQTFAPLSDSSDLKSFFKGFELSQLIYEIGGDEGINAYLSFLYSSTNIESLLNILDISNKNKSKATKIQISRYPKLIGLLISLTHAIDPGQLIKFTRILNSNNLELLESISYLYQSGQANIIKSKEDIMLLEPVVDQVVRGNFANDLFLSPDLNYEQANASAPVALRQWTTLIGGNLGSVSSKELITHLYDKSIGLTPAELTSILSGGSPSTPLGQMLDGLEGGKLTKFIKYANITGLGIKIGSYKNSSQLSNFKIENHTEYSLDIITLLNSLESVLSLLKTTELVFESSLDYSLNEKSDPLLDALLFSQNKTIESLSNTLYAFPLNEEGLETIKSAAGTATILESPGTGNSRVPNRIPVLNSITPEQYSILFAKNSTNFAGVSGGSNSELTKNLINKFIKFSEQIKLTNNVDNQSPQASAYNAEQLSTKKVSSRGYPLSETYFWSPATEYESPPQDVNTPTAPIDYNVGELVRQKDGAGEVKTNTLGVSYIPGKSADTSIAKISERILGKFDPVESCKKFGGENCEELYENVPDRCVNELNKSIYPEQYTSVPGVAPTAVVVDRPLGSFSEYKPNKSLIPTSSYMSPPKYLELLGGNFDGFGERGEPITSTISPQQIKFTTGGGEVSEFNNTEFAIFEGANHSTEVDSETKCAYLKSPFEYQLCMNMLKCKRFAPPLNGEYFLSFCPPITSGGRGK